MMKTKYHSSTKELFINSVFVIFAILILFSILPSYLMEDLILIEKIHFVIFLFIITTLHSFFNLITLFSIADKEEQKENLNHNIIIRRLLTFILHFFITLVILSFATSFAKHNSTTVIITGGTALGLIIGLHYYNKLDDRFNGMVKSTLFGVLGALIGFIITFASYSMFFAFNNFFEINSKSATYLPTITIIGSFALNVANSIKQNNKKYFHENRLHSYYNL